MFEVECPSCHAGYKVDERRIPPTGLKMRCPKCGESFQVAAGGASEPPVLGAALGLSGPGPGRVAKRTMIGVAPAGQEPPRAQSSAASPAGLELDTLEEPAEELDDSDLEADLPAPVGAPGTWGAGLPVPVERRSGPSPEKPARPSAAKEIDLFGDTDELMGPPVVGPDTAGLPSPAGIGEEFELPSPGAGLLDGSEVDLPDLTPLPRAPRAPGRSPSRDLPVAAETGLPSPSDQLPALSASQAGLPIVGGGLPSLGGNLPAPTAPGAGSVLPSLSPQDPSFGDAAEFDMAEGGFAASGDPGFDDGGGLMLSQAPSARSEAALGADPFGDGPPLRPESTRGGDAATFGQVDLEQAQSGEDDFGDEFDAFPTEEGQERPGGATTSSYGDVALEGGEDDLPLGEGSVRLDGEVERGASPGGPRAAASAQVELPTKEQTVPEVKTPRSGLSRGVKIGAGVALLLTVAGGALGALLPDVGPYGAYVIMDAVQADAHQASLEGDVQAARKQLAMDTAEGAARAFQIVDRGRAQAPRFRPRSAYAAYVGFVGELRFGAGSGHGAAAKALLEGLQDVSVQEAKYLELARLASAALAGAPKEAARPGLVGQSLDHAFLVGEAALRAGDGELALTAFQATLQKEASPRSFFGLARAQAMLGRAAEAEQAAEEVLRRTPAHPGAQLLLIERAARDRTKDRDLVDRLLPISEGQGGASVPERVRALILLGDLHLDRGRLSDAEAVFSKALSLESGNAVAQRGLADALFDSGRFSEAQTRYEAALKTDPNSLAAGLGLVRCRLRLEELETAVALLAQLKKAHPDSTSLRYWGGRAEEQMGHREVAQQAYEAAIKLSEPGPELVKAYIALTRLLGQAGKAEAAQNVIDEAEQRFPTDPLVYEALADLAASRGSYDAALEDYDRALELDPENLGLHFQKAIALRKARRFEQATSELAYVEKASKDYPGLALEQGNLLEASGRSAEALAAYEKALAEAPDSTDMMLRVGCARAAAAQGAPAVELLQKVYAERPNSAEVNFCLGLGYLHSSGKLMEAKNFLQRAVGFDASRASYHLYVGWVAIEVGDYPLANVSLDKALELDQTLADAYWKRGELRVKQGAVDDAVRDLQRALELSPSRAEAHAQLGLAYLQNGREPMALAEFQKATEQVGVDPYFNYRYGELLLNNRRASEAAAQLERALSGVKDREPAPPWTYEAHRFLAMALGRQRAAIEHWKVFADHAPANSPYLAEAVREMNAILAMTGH